jgi:hypothetical protein
LKINLITLGFNLNLVPQQGQCEQKRAQKILDNLPKGFTAVSMDESFFFFDSLIRKVWSYEGSRPVVRITGSHQHSSLFGDISLDGK